MSDEQKSQFRINTFLTALGMLCGVISVVVGIMVKLQTDKISLEQQNSNLIMMSTISEKYASKVELANVVSNQQKLDDSISRLTTVTSDNNTEIKLIRNQLAKTGNKYPQNYP